VSLAVYTPGSDYRAALEAVHYWRQCSNTSLVADYVTFHFYFPTGHLPHHSFMSEEFSANYRANCDQPPPNVDGDKTWVSYKARHKLTYPINVGRNVARQAATTHFVFASDIELYPSPGLIPKFLEMVRSQTNHHRNVTQGNLNPRVYVNTIFEMKKGQAMPENKTALLAMLASGDAVPFHVNVCPACHLVPKYQEWKDMPVKGKRDRPSGTQSDRHEATCFATTLVPDSKLASLLTSLWTLDSSMPPGPYLKKCHQVIIKAGP